MAECHRQAFMRHAAEIMRNALSLSFPPTAATSSTRRWRAAPMPSSSISRIRSRPSARRRRAQARSTFLKTRSASKQRPRLLVRINGLDTGMTDADLDADRCRRAGRDPVSEGGRRRQPSSMSTPSSPRAKPSPACPRARSRCWRRPWNPPPGCFSPAPFATASARLIGMTWGPEDLSSEIGAEANRDSRRPADRALPPRALDVPVRRGGGEGAGDRDHPRRFPQSRGACAATPKIARRDGFTGRLAIHPAQVPVINEVFTPIAGADRQGARRSSPPSRRSPAPARSASTARCTTGRIWCARRRCSTRSLKYAC